MKNMRISPVVILIAGMLYYLFKTTLGWKQGFTRAEIAFLDAMLFITLIIIVFALYYEIEQVIQLTVLKIRNYKKEYKTSQEAYQATIKKIHQRREERKIEKQSVYFDKDGCFHRYGESNE